MNRRIGIVALALYAVGAAGLTFGPSPGDLLFRVAQRVDGLDSLSSPAIEAIANLVLFVPLGLLLCAMLPRIRRLAVWASGRWPRPCRSRSNSSSSCSPIALRAPGTW